jgi:TonB family protein
MNNALVTGVLEVFSTSPAAFSNTDQKLLEGFAEECARIRQAAIELSQRRPAATTASPELIPAELIASKFIAPEFTPPEFVAASLLPARRSPYEAWTLVLGSLAILATIAVSFLIGSRVGWLRSAASHAQATNPIPSETSILRARAKSCAGTAAPGCPAEQSSAAPAAALSGKASGKAATRTSPAADELVVYEKGKVIFRTKPAPAKRQAKADSTRQDSDSVVEASSTSRIATTKLATTKTATTKTATTIAPAQSVWLSPTHAETRLLRRTEPQYPPAALASHRAGNVVLEVQVAEDGSVSSIRTLSGDPLLAAAATEAVRNWRYQPYRQHDQPAQFQTDVTLSFSLPN